MQNTLRPSLLDRKSRLRKVMPGSNINDRRYRHSRALEFPVLSAGSRRGFIVENTQDLRHHTFPGLLWGERTEFRRWNSVFDRVGLLSRREAGGERSVYSAGRCDAERAMNKTPGLLRDFPCRCVHFGAVLFHFRPSRRKRAAP
jgi:hypothetical protein